MPSIVKQTLPEGVSLEILDAVTMAGAGNHTSSGGVVLGTFLTRWIRRPQNCVTRPSASRTGTTTQPRKRSWPLARNTPICLRRLRTASPPDPSGNKRPRLRSANPIPNASTGVAAGDAQIGQPSHPAGVRLSVKA
jgi:hypothetical protein